MIVLTPNRRLAAFLQREYAQQQLAAGFRSWVSPEIYPLEAWFNQLWQLGIEHGAINPQTVLTKNQAQILWEKIINSSNDGCELLRISATAKSVIQAWKFMRQWQVNLTTIEAYANYSPDTMAFYTWLQAYLSWLTEHAYIDQELMIDQLIVNLPNFIDLLPRKICLTGVDDLPPQYANLVSVLQTYGIEITSSHMVQPGASACVTELANPEEELAAAADWAAEILRTNPKTVVGIVVPQLERKRQQVIRVFTSKINAPLLNVSAPMALHNYQFIDAALRILQLAKPEISYSDFSVLLRSPFILNAEQELSLRALLDRKLREKSEAVISWKYLLTVLETIDTNLKLVIAEFIDLIQTLHSINLPDYWIDRVQSLLNCWGWPGSRPLSVEEADLRSCWQQVLLTYSQLTEIVSEHTFAQALQLIMRIASEMPFLPAETGLTRIHILGVLEAAGIAFEHLWVTGMDRDSWPPDAAPNPYIPAVLQRALDMPRSSPQRELKVAKRLTETLKIGARQTVIFSYPRMLDGHINVASNLLAGLPSKPFDFTTKISQSKQLDLENCIDNCAPGLQGQITTGGTKILKLQAQCPFKAFAEVRLQANILEEPVAFLTAAQRGNIIHDILEKFWLQTRDHASLIKLMLGPLPGILTKIIDTVLTRWQKKIPNTLNPVYISLEQQRLLNLLCNWLEYEAKRAPFTVLQLEQKIEVSIGPLVCSIRLDRLDQLAEGELVIIDYKTGRMQINNWFSKPIIEPQMPIYAISCAEEISGVVVANIRAQLSELKFSGITSSDIMPNCKTVDDWPALQSEWNSTLKQTAEEYMAGYAAVEPFSAQICQRCKLQAVCRLYDC